MCFELQHPFDPSITSGGQITGTATITDANGSTTRSVPFTLDKGQRVDIGCSPATSPPVTGGGRTTNPCADDPAEPAASGRVYSAGRRGEVVEGTALRDFLSGGPGDDTLIGLASRDCLNGNGGNDRLAGGDGNDFLDGGAGDDVLEGGAGTDDLDSGIGNDVLIAGPEGAAQGQLTCGPGFDLAIASSSALLVDCEARLAVAPTPQRVVGSVVSGIVLVRFPGTKTFVGLSKAEPIPYGAVVDTRRGRVRIVAAHGADGIQASDFYDGVFGLVRRNGAKPLTEVALTGRLAGCGRGARGGQGAEEGPPPVGRRQGPLPHPRPAQRRDGDRHEMARRGPLRPHDGHTRDAGPRRGPRLRAPPHDVVLNAGQRYVAGRRRR